MDQERDAANQKGNVVKQDLFTESRGITTEHHYNQL